LQEQTFDRQWWQSLQLPIAIAVCGQVGGADLRTCARRPCSKCALACRLARTCRHCHWLLIHILIPIPIPIPITITIPIPIPRLAQQFFNVGTFSAGAASAAWPPFLSSGLKN